MDLEIKLTSISNTSISNYLYRTSEQTALSLGMMPMTSVTVHVHKNTKYTMTFNYLISKTYH